MAEILIRNVDDAVHARLKEKAARKGKSLQAYLRDKLEEASAPSTEEFLAEAARIRQSIKLPADAPPLDQVLRESREELEGRLDWMITDRLADGK